MKKNKKFLFLGFGLVAPFIAGLTAISCGGEKFNAFALNHVQGPLKDPKNSTNHNQTWFAESGLLDLSKTNITSIPAGSFSYLVMQNLADEGAGLPTELSTLVTTNSSNNNKKINIRKIILPKTLKSIGAGAFYGLSNLEEVDFSQCNDLSQIDAEAFSNTNIKKLQLPASLNKLGQKAFANSGITSVNLEDLPYLKTLTQGVFASNKLTNINLKNIELVESGALADNQIKTIEIPSTMKSFSPESFDFYGAGESAAKTLISKIENNEIKSFLEKALNENPNHLYKLS